MPNYCQGNSKNGGAIFPKCGSDSVAGSSANTSVSAGEDFSVIEDYSWDMVKDANGGASFELRLLLPAYQPIITSAFNILNDDDKIEKLVVHVTDGYSSRGTVTGTYTAEDGELVNASLSHGKDSKINGLLHLVFRFDKVTHDNKVTNTLGMVRESNNGLF